MGRAAETSTGGGARQGPRLKPKAQAPAASGRRGGQNGGGGGRRRAGRAAPAWAAAGRAADLAECAGGMVGQTSTAMDPSPTSTAACAGSGARSMPTN